MSGENVDAQIITDEKPILNGICDQYFLAPPTYTVFGFFAAERLFYKSTYTPKSDTSGKQINLGDGGVGKGLIWVRM